MQCLFPITDHHGTVIAPAGTDLTPRFVADLARRLNPNPEEALLCAHGSVRDDVLGIIRRPPYDVIFSGHGYADLVFESFSRVSLPVYVLSGLDYFKKNEPYTYLHLLSVFLLSALVIRCLTQDHDELELAVLSGPVHDIGKQSVPLEILRKPSPLTADEHARIRHHVVAGYVLLAIAFADPEHPAARVALRHHELRDGSGYPQGIRQNDFVVEIVSACDRYDALLSPRPYRVEPFTNRSALDEMVAQGRQGLLRPEIVSAFVALNRGLDPLNCQVDISGEFRGVPPRDNCYGKMA